MSIFVVGLNHRSAPLTLREQLALSGSALTSALHDLRDAGLQETVILSTCNRLEIYSAGELEITRMEAFITQWGQVTLDALRPHLTVLEDEAAVRHLLRVASGLESIILGETQVLGQVGEALEIAQQYSGAVLSHLFAQAIHTGKRARSETEISQHTTSVSHMAARLVHEQAGNQARVMIIGAGEMARLAALALEDHEIIVINRSYARAATLAHEVGGRALDWLQFGSALAWADVVISATSAPQAVIRTYDLGEHRPLLIDIGLPRNIDPAVSQLPGVELWTLDDLQARVDANLVQRSAAIAPVEAIVEQETALFMDWLHSREVAPVITELQKWARELAESEVTQALHRLDAPDKHTEQVITRMANRIVNKMLHEPTVRLKLHAAEGEGQDYAQALRDLFGLEAEDSPALLGESPLAQGKVHVR